MLSLIYIEIMKGAAFGSPIETKLQVTELSLLPPNSKGLMPAGVQRFPFEFPIPASLPTSVDIPDRLKIFYQLTATLRRSSHMNDLQDALNPIGWIDWARRNNYKKKYVAVQSMRIVRAVESIVTASLLNNVTTEQTSITPALTPQLSIEEVSNSSESQINGSSPSHSPLPWNRRSLDAYQSSYDEQHDRFAFSLAGRSSGNLTQPLNSLSNVEGVRYKIGIDRSAIAIGTSIGVELMIEPLYENAIVKSVLLKISESRKYAMKVPSDYTWSTNRPATKTTSEAARMVLKWAYGYQVEDEEIESMVHPSKEMNGKGKQSERYVRHRTANSQYLAYFDPPQPGCESSKSFLNSTFECSSSKKKRALAECNREQELETSSCSPSPISREMINLKELNQKIRVGEYFGGRFVMPVPDCSNILHPSMDYESIKISHWIQLIVTIECNGKTFELTLDSPGRILDCRVVAADDEGQTILPPPPKYQPGDGVLNNWTQSTFWEQREPITSVTGWGACVPCPCMQKKYSFHQKEHNLDNNNKTNSKKASNDNLAVTGNSCLPSHLPEWGPPPCYSEN
jgi:hypothetical protein